MTQELKNSIYYPMLVSNVGTAERLSPQEDSLIWKKYLTLPQTKRDIITAPELPQKIYELQNRLGVDEGITGQISLSIRKIFFGELAFPECEANIGNLLVSKGDDRNKARSIVEYIQREILTLHPKPVIDERDQEKPKTDVMNLPLLQALSKYEKLGNQLITSDRIKIKSQSEPVRPSLLYWLKYYRDELGIGHHDSVQRGQFLFRSENGKKLSPEERERLNLILKSVEENMPLQIDTENNEIIFPHFETPLAHPIAPVPPLAFEPAPPEIHPQPALLKSFPLPEKKETPRFVMPKEQTIPKQSFQVGMEKRSIPEKVEPVVGKGTLSFSSSHVFPAEKEQKKAEKIEKVPDQSNPFHIRPLSLQNKEKSKDDERQ